MPRDAAGNYTLPASNPVTAGTIIESAGWANPTLNDIAVALSDSLSRSGSGGMLVPFRNADGNMGSPGISWINEPTSGWYRAALNDFRYSVGNEDIFKITKAGIELMPGKNAVNISSFVRVQDAEPISPAMKQGEMWYESDTGGFYMRYQNPDSTFTFVSLAAAGGNFAALDSTGRLPIAQQPLIGIASVAGFLGHGLTASTFRVLSTTRAVLLDSSGNAKQFGATGPFDIAITTSGAGGLDSGAEAASTWYYIWLIGKDDGTQSAIFSASATAPTMPAGYTWKARVGAVRNDAASNLILAWIRGDRVFPFSAQVLLNNGVATVETALTATLVTLVPPAAESYELHFRYMKGDADGAGALNMNFNTYIGGGSIFANPLFAHLSGVAATNYFHAGPSIEHPNSGYLAYAIGVVVGANPALSLNVPSFKLPVI